MKCPKCEGYGKLVRQAPPGFSKPFDCPDCKGTGKKQK